MSNYIERWDSLSGGIKRRSRTPDIPPGGTTYGVIGSYKPDATTSGVPSGTALTVFNGDLTATAGQTIQNLDVHGRIIVKVANVTIKNCYIRGTANASAPLIQCYDAGVSNLLIQDCTLRPNVPMIAAGSDGITGHDYTALRCDVSGTIDAFGVYNTNNSGGPVNVSIQGCYAHDLCFITPDSGHSDNHTHNDCVQIQGGSNISIIGNNLQGFTDPAVSTYGSMYPNPAKWTNSVVQVTQSTGNVSGVTFTQNWVDGGGASLNLAGVYTNFGSITSNRFGRNPRLGDTYGILYNGSSTVTISGNVYDDTGTAITYHSNGS